MPKDRLYVTYFGGNKEMNLMSDNEARDIWLSLGCVHLSAFIFRSRTESFGTLFSKIF